MLDHDQDLALQALAHCLETIGPVCTARLLGTISLDLIEADEHADEARPPGPDPDEQEKVSSGLASVAVTSAPARDTAGPPRRQRNG